MKNIKTYTPIIIIVLISLFFSCQKEHYEIGDITAPTNVQLDYEIVGADGDNPNGDGSGVVNFTVTADNAITYTFDFGDGQNKEIAGDGTCSHMFTITGINTYNVVVNAVGTGGVISTALVQLDVLSTFSDDEAVQFLTGGSSKSWYWAADQTGHLGLGPNSTEYGEGYHTWPQWYQAAPWEKAASSLYDCEFVYTLEENGSVTFEQLNPTGEAFIQGLYSAEFGFGEEGSYTFDISGVKNVSFSPANSIATIDGGYRGTSMSYSDAGFMGFYAGSSEYEIIEVTEHVLKVRMVQANEPLFAWYHIFTDVKPEQP